MEPHHFFTAQRVLIVAGKGGVGKSAVAAAVALASALARAVADPWWADRLRTAGRAHAEGYSMDRLAGLYVGLYERALAMEADDIVRAASVPRMLRPLQDRIIRASRAGRGRTDGDRG